MIFLSGSSLSSGAVCLLPNDNKMRGARSYGSTFLRPEKLVFSCIRGNSLTPPSKLNYCCTPLGTKLSHLCAASAPLLSGEHGSLSYTVPVLLKKKHSNLSPRASKDIPSKGFRFPPMTKKPRWYWRTLACLPYLITLHLTFIHAETAYHLHPFLESFEFLAYPFLIALARKLPQWFQMSYLLLAYFGIVKRKEWPHFLRFHVINGVLLQFVLDIVNYVSCWMPLSVYWGKVGMHVWVAVAFAYMFTVLECIRCALAGMYADIPFVCDAAYMLTPYD